MLLTCYIRVQPYIAEAMEVALSRLIGFRHNQFGKTTWVAHCIYEDKKGQIQYKWYVLYLIASSIIDVRYCGSVKIHSKLKTWSSISDNDLQLEEYCSAVSTWAAQGFDG